MLILALWFLFGFDFSWTKICIGRRFEWIGLEYEVDSVHGTVVVRIPDKTIEELAVEIESMLRLAMIAVRTLRRFAGKAAWITALATRCRWATQRIWA